MNEYKDALNWMYTLALPCASIESYEHRKTFINERYDTLQKLVNRATPKKPILVSNHDGFVYECPICHMDFRPNFIVDHIEWKGCPYCLQALDWSKEDETIIT